MLFFAIKCSIRPNKVVSKDVGGKKKKNRKSFRTGTDSLNHVYHITKSIKKHNFQFKHATHMPKIVLGDLHNIPRSHYEVKLKKKRRKKKKKKVFHDICRTTETSYNDCG